MNKLGIVLRTAGRLEESELAHQRAIDVYERSLGPDHPRLAEALGNYEALLRQVGRVAEADAVESRVEAIRARAN